MEESFLCSLFLFLLPNDCPACNLKIVYTTTMATKVEHAQAKLDRKDPPTVESFTNMAAGWEGVAFFFYIFVDFAKSTEFCM